MHLAPRFAPRKVSLAATRRIAPSWAAAPVEPGFDLRDAAVDRDPVGRGWTNAPPALKSGEATRPQVRDRVVCPADACMLARR